MRLAAIFVLISAVLHVIAAILSGFAWEGLKLLPFAAIYGLLGLGLMQGRRWVAWLTFLMMLVFSFFALMMSLEDFPEVPPQVSAMIVAADWLTAACLLVVLWRGQPSAQI